ncbi:MAG: hypothetical protein NUV34_10010 [Sulfuricaulis sp.]|nr:hypothetical protein [Sulfuricaulis sp.]
MNTFGTSLEIAGDRNNQLRRPDRTKNGGGWFYAGFKPGDRDSIIAAAKYVGATDAEIQILLGNHEVGARAHYTDALTDTGRMPGKPGGKHDRS